MLLIILAFLKSRYGSPDGSNVTIDVYDSLEVLGTVEKPKNVKMIGEMGFTTRAPALNEYPYPGNSITLSDEMRDIITKESNSINSFLYQNTNMKQEDLFKHPAGPHQFGGTYEDIDKAERVKVKLTIDTRFGMYHTSGLYVPPGELITIELPDIAVGKGFLIYNLHTDNINFANREDLPRMPQLYYGSQNNLPLNRKVCKVGNPYGGSLSFTYDPDTFADHIEIIISGAILAPWYRYGVDTEEDWEQIKKYPGLLATIETGNIQMTMPSHIIRNVVQIDSTLIFYRSCHQIMESTVNKRCNYGPRSNGREKLPNQWYFDIYVKQGEAYAAQGGNNIHAPNYWAQGLWISERLLTEGNWGILHEMGHHHQGTSGTKWGIGYKDEVTNNVLNAICYSILSNISSRRYETTNPESIYGDWPRVAHPYTSNLKPADEQDTTKFLYHYVSFMHTFGTEKMRKFISTLNTDTDKSIPHYVYTAAKQFGYDIREFLEYYLLYDPDEFASNEVIAQVEQMNLPPYYPINNVYQTGYSIGGTITETARPFRIPTSQVHRFDFMKYSIHPLGEWSFVKLESLTGRDSSWVSKGDGIFDYTPSDDHSFIDEYQVTYHESTSNQDVICYGKIEQIPTGVMVKRYEKVFTANTKVMNAYNNSINLEPTRTIPHTGLSVPTTTAGANLNFLAVATGQFEAPTTDTYTFYAVVDEQCLFYLSEEKLAADPNIDAEYLILDDSAGYHNSYDKNKGSTPVSLEEGKRYNFVLVVYNSGGGGSGKIGYSTTKDSTIVDVPSDCVYQEGGKKEDIHDWVPNWEDIPHLSDYYKSKSKSPDFISITGPQQQTSTQYAGATGQSGTVYSLINGNTDDFYISFWTPKADAPQPPYTFDIKIAEGSGFKHLKIHKITQKAPTYKVNTNNLTITCNDEILYTGPYNSDKELELDYESPKYCTDFQVIQQDNKNKWSGARNEGGTAAYSEFELSTEFSVNNVIPITHPNISLSGTWKKSKTGSNFNTALYGSEGSTLEFNFTKPVNEFVLLSDRKYTGSTTPQNTATVYVNGEMDLDFTTDLFFRPEGGEKTYKNPVYISTSENITNVKIVVKEGEIGLSGILANDVSLVDISVNEPEEPEEPENPDKPVNTDNIGEPVNSNEPDNQETGSPPLGGGEIAGIVIAIIVVAAIIICAVYFLVIRKKTEVNITEGNNDNENDEIVV